MRVWRIRVMFAVAATLAATFVVSAPASALTLPDSRAYEKVTPNDKNDFDMLRAGGDVAAWPALTADKLYFFGVAAYDSATSSFGTGYVASREAAGWTTQAVTGSESPGDYLYNSFLPSDDLSKIALQAIQGDFTRPPFVPTLLELGPAGGPLTTMAALPPADVGTRAKEEPVGGTPDLSHVALQVADPTALDPPATGTKAGRVLYLWHAGELSLVSVDEQGSPFPCGAVLGNGEDSHENSQINTVTLSPTGSPRVFFISPDPDAASSDSSCALPTQLYARDGDTTIDVSAPEPGVVDPNGPQTPIFAGASEDGSRVFFLSTQELTTDDTTHDLELYEYDLDTRTLTRVSRGETGDADGNVQWTIVSPDGSLVYLVTFGQMVPGTGAAGEPNMYAYNTITGSYRYVATLTSVDVTDATLGACCHGPDAASNWYITPNSRYLLFASSADLTPDSPSTGSGEQLYRYDSESGSITCTSCPPPGTAANGDAEFTEFEEMPPGFDLYKQPMTDDGSTVFFDTPTQLVAADNNDKRDVYEWHNGTLSLLSSGDDAHDSFFVGSGNDGRDAYFSTRARLVPEDQDDLDDIYDARIGGGFPQQQPAPDCSADGCQGALSAQPLPPTVASITFAAPSSRSGITKVKVLSRSVRGTSFLLRVTVPSKGNITVKGSGLRGATRSTSRRGTYRMRVTLTSHARRVLQRRRKLKLKVRVRFAAARGPVSSARVSLTVRPAIRRHQVRRTGATQTRTHTPSARRSR